MNLDEIIKYERPKQTFYDLLGCAKSSSVEQISREYKIRALQLHPDKTNSDPKSNETFRMIQLAKETLCDESTRKSYDCWLDSNINIPFELWQSNKGHSMHWGQPRSRNLCINETASKATTTNVIRDQGNERSQVVTNNGNNRQGGEHTSSLKSCNRDVEDGGKSLLAKFRNYEI